MLPTGCPLYLVPMECRVLNQGQAMAAADTADRIKVCCLPGKIHCYHRFCSGRDMSLDGSRINVIGLGIDVCKHRFSSAVEDAVCGSRKGDGRCDDLVPFLDSGSHGGNMQSCGAIAYGNAVSGACQIAKLLFQFFDTGAAGQIIAAQGGCNSFHIRFINILLSIAQGSLPYGNASVDCQLFHIYLHSEAFYAVSDITIAQGRENARV